ncbi:MAG: ribonuclease Z [Muribaculaceae bacterium]
MNEFSVHILGCGSAMPTMRHMPSCQAIEYHNKIMLVDCGEGAQLSLRRARLKFSRVSHIFISHLHGDHMLGLPGLLSTLSMHDLGGTVHVHIFEEGARLMREILSVICHGDNLNVEFDVIPAGGGVVYEDKSLTVTAFPLYHRVPCVGFVFREKEKQRHLRGDMVEYLKIPVSLLPDIKAGADFVKADGTVVPNERLTTAASHVGSYAYCSDTMFNPAVAEAVKGVDVLYHEATYAHDKTQNAATYGHSTAAQAAEIARLAGVKTLLIGHYSKRYEDTSILLNDAKEIFPNTIAANEGDVISLV